MTLLIVGMSLLFLLVIRALWMSYQLMVQNGRMMLRVEELETQIKRAGVAPAPASPPRPQLAFGSAAPEFELPDLDGTRHSLAEFRGKRVLLLFSGPGCGFCLKMYPDLAALPIDGKHNHPIPVMITNGDAERNREHVKEYKIRGPVLLQEGMTVASEYMVTGTPMGYIIDEQGNIASDLAVGANALMSLAKAPPLVRNGASAQNGSHQNGNGTANGKANKGLDQSRINREGLRAGTAAPMFRLPQVDGGELNLKEYHGRRTLLVFSDPDCGPCDRLAPQLEELHRTRNDFSILMVSRRDEEANRKKIESLGLTFPVVLQKNWEISKLYGMFATPIAYLINEQGIIVSDVAKGVDPILALVSTPESMANGSDALLQSTAEVASA
jgi:peroxiredoxin